jgi:hypothetical protein
MRGKLVNNREGSNRRCDISQMDLDNARAFIAQIFIEGVTGDKLNKTIYYWGFNPQGDFFIQIY